MGGLPFLLAHIEVVVARRAAPVDAVGRLAGDEATVLPEILARTGAPAAMQPVDDGGGDAPRFQDQPRDGGRERVPFAGGPAGRLELLLPRIERLGHRLIRCGPSAG